MLSADHIKNIGNLQITGVSRKSVTSVTSNNYAHSHLQGHTTLGHGRMIVHWAQTIKGGNSPMFTVTRTISRLTQASLVGAAIAFSSISTAAEAKSPMRWTQHSANNVVKQAPSTRYTPRGLPSNMKSGVENLSRTKLNNVRVHYNQNPARINANSFTKGGKIHLAPGQARHLPHELNHVTTQRQGRVSSGTSRRSGSLKNSRSFSNTSRSSNFAKRAKSARTVAKTHQTSKVARHANRANKFRKGAKAAKTARNVARIATAGTGVGAVVGITAGLAGVDPIEMATLKATNPAEYNRRMRSLKKNPVKYMGNNMKKNTKKVAQNVGNAGKKAGCGIGNVFKKKRNRKKC
jgi:hypothetical protein